MALLRYDSSDDSPDWYVSQNPCSFCEDQEKKKEHAGEWLEEVISLLYSHNDLDLNRLENALDELSHYFGKKLCVGDLMIERFKEIACERPMV